MRLTPWDHTDTETDMTTTRTNALVAFAFLPFAFGFTNCGGAFFSQDEAPDMNGTWDITYADDLTVEIELGGAVYTSELGAQGGTVEIEHDGQPLSFELDCASEDIVCPSEVWLPQVELEQREAEYPHRVWMPVEKQVCDGEEIEPVAEECGEGTDNPDCDKVCDGEMVTETVDAFGLIDEDGDEFALLLGGGVASNGVNCAMLGLSVAEGDLVTTGGPAAEETEETEETEEASNLRSTTEPWVVEQVTNGVISVGYAGGCLWADDVDGDQDLEAVVIGAKLIFRTSFEANRAEAGIL